MKSHYRLFRKFIVVLLILSAAVCLLAEPAFFLDINSFTGSWYYPAETENPFSYFDRQDFGFGIRYSGLNGINLLVRQSYSDTLFRRELELDSLLISYAPENKPLKISLLAGKAGFSQRREPFTGNQTLPFREKLLFGDYKFTGVVVDVHTSDNLSTQALIGGDKYHKGIMAASLSHRSTNLTASLFYLYSGKDDVFYRTTHLAGKDVGLQAGVATLRNALGVNYYPEGESDFVYTNYSEFVLMMPAQFKTGCSFYYKSNESGLTSRKEFTGFLSFESVRWYHTLFYNNVRAGAMIRQNISPVLLYRLSEKFLIGLENSIYLPDKASSYYSFGVLVRYNDAFSL